MAQWHSVDLTNFDVAPVARMARRASETAAKRTLDLAKDATYVTVGMGLLSFQRACDSARKLRLADSIFLTSCSTATTKRYSSSGLTF